MSGDQTYVSQEVCTSVLHECRGAIKRASVVSVVSVCIINMTLCTLSYVPLVVHPQLLSERELSDVARGLYSIILDKLCTEHFHTALDIALAGIYSATDTL